MASGGEATDDGMDDPQVVAREEWLASDRVFHTYSSYARGCDLLVGTYNWLDLTARGRQEDWEQPPGRSDSPLMGWLRHHDGYGT